jgi:hypothetical protein
MGDAQSIEPAGDPQPLAQSVLTQRRHHMVNPRRIQNPLDADDLNDLPDDLRENIEDTPTDEFGDETQDNEERTAQEGLEQTDLIDPRGEDEDDLEE